MKSNKLKTKPVTGFVRIVKAILYKGHMVYVRMLGNDYFEYLLDYNGQIYSSYIIMKPAKGKKKLTEDEILQCSALIYAGAEATLDELLGIKMDEKTEEYAKAFEENREKVEGK